MPPEPLHATSLDVGMVRSADGLEALRPAWQSLWEAHPTATPFQTPGWLIPWWKHFNDGYDLRVLTLRRDGQLVGVAPFVSESLARKLRFLGCGVSDYLDVLVDPTADDEATSAIAFYLAKGDHGCDSIELDGIREKTSPLLRYHNYSGAIVSIRAGLVCPSVSTREEAVPHSWKKKLAYDRRKLEQLGRVSIRATSSATLVQDIHTLFRLHEVRRQQVGGRQSAFTDSRVRAFHLDAAENALRDGTLCLYSLVLGDVAIASYYGFIRGSRAYYYLGGFDPAWAKYGPGNLIVDYARSEALQHGASTFDFLRGQEAYKYRWGAHDETTWILQMDRHRDERPTNERA
ncbi:MAG: GNAT family N-acetyltransferase [Nibricoccus sp.]